MTYVTITDSVMFINQDPKQYGIFKSLVIDLEALMKKSINKTKWKKIKKNYKRVMQNIFLDEEQGMVLVMQNYSLKGDKGQANAA